ncbi:MAG: ABC transporter permease [Burkholderiales bacterium]|jgi:cobalt/nickel transport system permease protein|nr:ABC transporter permease [Burkholderiales bacterium]
MAARMSRDTLWLALYAAALLALGFIHDPAVLGALLAIAALAAGPARSGLLRRAVLSVLLFNLSVSLGYALLALWRGDLWTAATGQYLLRINLRVLLMVFLGFWLVSRVNLLRALRCSPTLSLVATLASGQARTFTRVLRDFRLAFASRDVGQARWRDRTRHAAAQAAHLLDKSLANAEDTALAMRSRGCFDE